MGDDRRLHRRQTIALPTRVSGRTVESDVGMTLDLSAAGVLLTTRHRYKIGEQVSVSFRTPLLSKDPKVSKIAGTVVRTKRIDDEETLWPYEVAIRFDSVMPELLPLLMRPDSNWNIEDRLLLSSDEPSYRS